jgi:hypothetical protein
MQGLKYLHVQRKKKCSDCWKFKLTIKKKTGNVRYLDQLIVIG